MKKTKQIYFYSKIEPSIVKTSKYELYIQGNPVLCSSSSGTEDWINLVVREIEDNYDRLEEYFRERLRNTSGLFSLILIAKDKIILAGDAIRSYPLLYGHYQGRWFITDNIENFQKENGSLEVDEEKYEEFFAYGNVFGNRTFYKDIYALQAGEIVSICEEDISSDRYFIFKPADKPDIYKNQFDFTRAFDDLFLFVFSRMVKNRPHVNNWIVPLSGGHDSRLVVNYLYRLGVKDVICFSYGTPDNEQARISKQVASALGYEWYFVEYNEQKWNDLHSNGLFGDYIDYAFNGVSTPHLQDFLAVYELKSKGVIREGDVFLPGHTTITETVFSEETLKLKTKEEAIQYVYSKIIVMKPALYEDVSILVPLKKIYYEFEIKPEDFMSLCDWQERQAKYITNSVRGYDFFGFECYQPMWDMEMVDFWLKIPAEGRVEREPLYQMEKNGGLVEKLAKIPYTSDIKKSLKNFILGVIRRLLPESIIIKLLRVTKRKTRLNEGLNQIYALSAKSVKDLLDPVRDFPQQTHPYFSHYFERLPFQMNYNTMTTLYTIRRLLDRSKGARK